MDEYAQEEFEQADNALADAKKLRQSGGTDRAVVNRLSLPISRGYRYTPYCGYDPTIY